MAEQRKDEKKRIGRDEVCCPIEIVDRGNRDPDYEGAQRDAGGDYTTSVTGGIPVGETVELSGDNLPDDLPGDEVDDIPTTDRNHPGTIDDVPYSVDEDDTTGKPPLEPLATGSEERDLWEQQQPLLDEDREAGYELIGLPENEVADVQQAIGDDASEQAQGYSITGEGSPYEAEHGGFPRRKKDDQGSTWGEDESLPSATQPSPEKSRGPSEAEPDTPE